MLRNVEPIDAAQFDLLEFGLKNERNYSIIFAIAKDLLKPLISIVVLESTSVHVSEFYLKLEFISKMIFWNHCCA